jgi:predicted hydrocarbon binding protein
MTVTVATSTTTAMELPVAYVAPGQPLAEVFVHLEGWQQLSAMMEAASGEAQPRLVYAYQLPGSDRLLAKLVLGTTASADEAALTGMLNSVTGLEVISVQPPAEAGLMMSERQRPELAGTPAVIFGRPVIGSLTRGILEKGADGDRLLFELGHDAGRLAASALPPLIEQLGMTVSSDLLARRMRDLQVMGWAVFGQGSIDGESHGEVTLTDTFEAASWGGDASSPTCHFLRGFIAGVFAFVWGRSVTCRELECQAVGAAACRFAFDPS